VHSEGISSLKLDNDLRKRAIKIDERLYVVEGKFEKDFLILQTFQQLMAEENTFKFNVFEEESFILLLDLKKEKIIGYIIWVKNDNYKDFKGSDILKRIYIIESERNNGYGTKFLKFWVENYANKVNGRFGISLCIDSSLIPIVIRLGYAERIDDRIKPIKFYVSPGFKH
jgi:GNAT superfamily N-acetyltransferase